MQYTLSIVSDQANWCLDMEFLIRVTSHVIKFMIVLMPLLVILPK
jgi:hypothetical protein